MLIDQEPSGQASDLGWNARVPDGQKHAPSIVALTEWIETRSMTNSATGIRIGRIDRSPVTGGENDRFTCQLTGIVIGMATGEAIDQDIGGNGRRPVP